MVDDRESKVNNSGRESAIKTKLNVTLEGFSEDEAQVLSGVAVDTPSRTPGRNYSLGSFYPFVLFVVANFLRDGASNLD